jgi:hypothetical protein
MFAKKNAWVGALPLVLVATEVWAQASPFSTGATTFQAAFSPS